MRRIMRAGALGASVLTAVSVMTIGTTSQRRAGAASGSSVVTGHWANFEAAVQRATTEAENYQLAGTAPGGVSAAAASYVRSWAQYVLEVQLLAADPTHPVLLRDPDPFAVPGANPPERSGIYSPDNISYIAVINPADEYRITARRGNSADFSYQVISGFPGNGTTGTPTSSLLRDQIHIGADGRYTITVGGPTQPNNWLPTVPQTTIVTFREAFNDWTRAVPDQLTISMVGGSGGRPATLSESALDGALDAAAHAVTVQTAYWTNLWGSLLQSLPANVIRTPSATQGGLAGQLSSLSHFQLGPDQALVVTVGKSDAAYQGFEAADAFGQTLPPATRPSSLNASQARPDSDGMLRFVVAARDPGVPNWIDTQGATDGFLFLRWQGLPGPLPPADAPTAQVVSLTAVRTTLPAGTPQINPAQRAAALRARAQALGRRLRISSNQAATTLSADLRRLASSVGRGPVAALFRGTSLPGMLGS